MEPDRYSFGPFVLDRESRTLTRDGEIVPLTSKAFDILVVLVRNAGRVVDKTDLMREVWAETVVHENNLAQQIAQLRRALGDLSRGGRYVATISGSGYQFVAPVIRVASHKVKVLGVLPMRRVEPVADEDYLGLWLVDALVTRLRSVRGIHVVAVGSVLDRVAPGDDPIVAGTRIGADVVLSGSVSRDGEHVRVDASLVDVHARVPIWSDTFDEVLSNVFVLQDTLTERVARALAPDLSAHEGEAIRKRKTSDAAAYRLYLSGRFLLDKRTKYGLEKSVEYFERAVTADPDFAAAYVGIADALAVLAFFQANATPPVDLYERALAAAARALELDPELAEAHAALGLLQLDFLRDWEASRASFARALALDPRYATAYFWYGRYLLLMGDQAGAEAAIRRALDLEPVSPTMILALGGLYFLLRRYDEALVLFTRAGEMESDNGWSRMLRGRILEQLGKLDDAEECFRRALALSPGSPAAASAMAHLDALRGRRAAALDRATASDLGFSVELALGLVHVALGEPEVALDYLERALDDRTLPVLDLIFDPRLDSVRALDRYRRMVRSLRLPHGG